MSVGQEFIMVAANCADGGEKYFADLKRSLNAFARGADLFQLNVPSGENGLQFGSFDNLIRLTDDLQKYDQQIESIVHRLERQAIELESNVAFKVTSQRQEKSFLEYFKTWTWDEAKYPKHRSLTDNMALLMKSVNQFDEETRSKTAQFNDLKAQKSSIAFKDQAVLTGKDMIDVFTPGAVTAGSDPAVNDFVYSEYLDTVVVILPKGADVEFLKTYERMAENVVPASAKHFKALNDKDGNMLWRVICFKSASENLKKAFRDKRWTVRDFVFDAGAHEKLVQQRETVDKQIGVGASMIKGLYMAAWSDTVVAWMHVKAGRIFVESVLRFGMPPTFASFCISPIAGKTAVVRKCLQDVMGGDAAAVAGGDDEEEMFPYVSLTIAPFIVIR